MEDEFLKQMFNMYEKAIEEKIRYKVRIERNESQLRNLNQDNQFLKGEIAFKNAKIIELEDKLNNK